MRYIFYSLLLLCFSASAQQGTVKDIDGNVYHIVKIGTQRWMKEELKTAHYRDGSPIKEIKLKTPWSDSSESKGACYYYDSHRANSPTYGKLYNWYAVIDPRHLCPTGWHVPSDSEWTVLTDHLVGDTIAGGKMKAAALWKSPNTGEDNSSGLKAQPADGHYGEETFGRDGYYDDFWSSTETGSNSAWTRCLFFINSPVYVTNCRKEYPLSVRCVGD